MYFSWGSSNLKHFSKALCGIFANVNEATILLINMVSLQQWRAAIAGSGCRRIHGDSVILGPRSRPEVDLPHITSPTVKATLEEARTQPFASWLAKLRFYGIVLTV